MVVIRVSTGSVRSIGGDVAADEAAEDVALGQDAERGVRRRHDEDGIAGAGPPDRLEAVPQARARRDGHRLAPADHLQPLVEQGRDACDDGALGQVVHAAKCIEFRPRDPAAPTPAAVRQLARRRRAPPAALVASAGGTPPPGRRDRAGRRVGGRLRLRNGPLEADLRGRARLAPAARLAVRDRGGAGLGLAARLGRPARRRSAGSAGARPSDRAGLGVWYTGNAGTYYAGLETVPASLAGVLVYLYPAIVAVLSVRYATRLTGRRPWIALGIALVGVILALGGIELDPPPPVSGLAPDPRLARDLRRLDHPVRPARRRADRPPGPRDRGDRPGRRRPPATTTLMISATAVVFVGARDPDGPAARPGPDPGRRLAVPRRDRVPEHVPRDPDVLRGCATDRGGPGGARQHGRAADHRDARVGLPRRGPRARSSWSARR